MIPRTLAIEIIDSIELMFSRDKKSRKILRGLILTDDFDPDCMPPGSSGYRRSCETEKVFVRLGSRLEEVYAEIEDPTPRGVQGLAEKFNKQRHVMMAVIAGIVIAIVLGILGLVVGVVQVWISYQQWKHPVRESTGNGTVH